MVGMLTCFSGLQPPLASLKRRVGSINVIASHTAQCVAVTAGCVYTAEFGRSSTRNLALPRPYLRSLQCNGTKYCASNNEDPRQSVLRPGQFRRPMYIAQGWCTELKPCAMAIQIGVAVLTTISSAPMTFNCTLQAPQACKTCSPSGRLCEGISQLQSASGMILRRTAPLCRPPKSGRSWKMHNLTAGLMPARLCAAFTL